jgi:ATP-binding cassette, subfamily B, vacuolar membrane transporter HMT1/ACLQ
MDALSASGVSQMSTSTATEVVYLRAQLLYPVVLLLAFIVSAGVHSIVTARTEEELVVPTAKGPGGKPLPVTKRKREQLDEPRGPEICAPSGFARRVFQYTTAAVILSFFANGGAIALHALQLRRKDAAEGWWCTEERTVSFTPASLGGLEVLMLTATPRSMLLVPRSCMSMS